MQPAFREVSRRDYKHENWKLVSFVILHFCTVLNRLGFILWSGLLVVRSKQGNARRTVVSKHGAIWVLILNAMDKDVEIQTKHGVLRSSLNFCSTLMKSYFARPDRSDFNSDILPVFNIKHLSVSLKYFWIPRLILVLTKQESSCR